MAAKNLVTSNEINQLAKLAIDGNFDQVQQLATGALVKAHGKGGRTVLMLAAKVDPCPKCLELFLCLGADPFATDAAGDTAAHLAARRDKLRLLALLPFESKWKRNGSGLSPLMVAAQAGSWGCAKHLLHLLREPRYNKCSNKRRKEMLGMESGSGQTASALARVRGHADLARVIELEMKLVLTDDMLYGCVLSGLSASEEAERQQLERLARAGDGASLQRVANRVNCDLPNELGQTALMVAAGSSSCDEASLQMLAKIADPTCADVLGSSCLHYAASSGRAVSVRVLLAAGAHAKARDDDGWTPLMLAAIMNASPSVAPLLLPASDLSATDLWGRTALDFATLRGHNEWAALLRGDTSPEDGDEVLEESPASESGEPVVATDETESGEPVVATDETESGGSVASKDISEPGDFVPPCTPDSHISEP